MPSPPPSSYYRHETSRSRTPPARPLRGPAAGAQPPVAMLIDNAACDAPVLEHFALIIEHHVPAASAAFSIVSCWLPTRHVPRCRSAQPVISRRRYFAPLLTPLKLLPRSLSIRQRRLMPRYGGRVEEAGCGRVHSAQARVPRTRQRRVADAHAGATRQSIVLPRCPWWFFRCHAFAIVAFTAQFTRRRVVLFTARVARRRMPVPPFSMLLDMSRHVRPGSFYQCYAILMLSRKQ